VLDVMNGAVVRAVGGRRSVYRPIVSRLTDSTDPLAVAKALLAATGAGEIYVADLDSITRGVTVLASVSDSVSHLIRHLSVTVWLDIGLRDDLEAVHLKRFRNVRPVIASETLGGGAPLIRATVEDVLRMKPAVSIDLRNGELISASSDLASPLELADLMHTEGYRTFLLLDLARVGMNAGPGTEPLCGELRRRYPEVELLVGGGVRNRDDMRRLEDAGADGVLVASALHDGTLP
jgi:phosphoribosylformimino-5-aminoimidazole carboxamide ribotide isomerase